MLVFSRRFESNLQTGSSLIEALIALLVLSSGMIALSAVQLGLSRDVDVAKQRSEATRIASERIEQARSYTSLMTSSAIDWVDLAADVALPITVSSNARFDVEVIVGGAAADAARAVQVTVRWTDRTGAFQSVALSTVVARSDPKEPGFTANPLSTDTVMRRPQNHSFGSLVPALDLGGGRASLQFDANYVVVFDAASAGIRKICQPNHVSATREQLNTALDGGQCAEVRGYLVAGYVGRTGSLTPWPSGVHHAAVVRNAPLVGEGIRCLYAHAASVAGVPVAADHGFQMYVCLVPLATPFEWGGTFRLAGVPTTGDYIVCRYQFTQTTVPVSQRNEQPYQVVNRSIVNQNYLVTSSDTGICPSSMTVPGVSIGVLHQDCRVANAANHSAVCPAG